MRIGKTQVPVVGVYLPLAGGTMTGDIQMQLNKLLTTDLLIKQSDAETMSVRNLADDADRDLIIRRLKLSDYLISTLNGGSLYARDTDGNYFVFAARDTGVGGTEVARLQGAADPYFQATLPMVLKPAAIPGTLVEGHFGYDSVTDKLWYRDAAGTKYLDPTVTVYKVADETINNSNVLQNDNELLLPVEATCRWRIDLLIRCLATAVADFKWAFTVPAGGSVRGFYVPTAPASAIVPIDFTAAQITDAIAAERWIAATLIYVGGGTAGNLQLQWAQNAAEATNCTVYLGSHMICRKLA